MIYVCKEKTIYNIIVTPIESEPKSSPEPRLSVCLVAFENKSFKAAGKIWNGKPGFKASPKQVDPAFRVPHLLPIATIFT